MMKSPAEPAAKSHSRSSHGLHLACRECQRKKVKCDRTYPCGQCSRGGFPCVPSTRKPRAKTGAKAADAELRQRIAKLEKLVESFQGEEGGGKEGVQPETSSPTEDPNLGLGLPQQEFIGNRNSSSPSSTSDGPPARRASKFVAGTFWSSLTKEVKALADAFEDEDEDDEELASPEGTPDSGPYGLDTTQAASQNYELIFCPPGVLYIMPNVFQEPDEAMSKLLLESYLAHVETLQRLFHSPSLRAFMDDGAPYLGRPPDAPCNKALKAAVHFAGVNSMTDEECQLHWGKSLEQMATESRRMVDIALYQADPLNTNELATLQALITYVGAIRILDPSRRAWSMVALVTRIATAMSIHRELPGETPFMAELRRRAWYNIVFLDCYSSIDRGSEPAIHPDGFTRRMCSNVNDSEFDEHSTSIPDHEGKITDMSMALVTHEGSLLSLRMSLAEDTVSFPWQRRLEQSYVFQKRMHERFLRFADPNNPMHAMMIGTANASSHSLMLRAVRPIQYNTDPPPVDSPWVMQLAVNILRHSDLLWETHSGLWRRMPWVPWHAMAVTLAALCSIRGTEQANEAWSLVDRAMARYGNRIADSKNGMLWKPLQRAYQKAAAFRDGKDTQMPAQATNTNPIWNNPGLGSVDPATGIPLDGLNMNMQIPMLDTVFDFPPEMQAALPNDNSWLDWEAMMKDMVELKGDEMQWI